MQIPEFDFNFICPRHREWLEGSPEVAGPFWRSGFEQAQRLMKDKDWLNAWRHAGCAYETAQMMVRDARCCDRGWVRRYSASAAQLAMLSQVLEMGPSASATVH